MSYGKWRQPILFRAQCVNFYDDNILSAFHSQYWCENIRSQWLIRLDIDIIWVPLDAELKK